MKTAVIDTGVFVAGVFWRHEPHLILKAWRRGVLWFLFSVECQKQFETVPCVSANPKGIESISPGLRGTRYPGARQRNHKP